MLKIGTTLFTIIAIVVATTTTPLLSQPPASSGPNDPPANAQAKAENERSKKNRPDLKKVFEEETKKFNEKSAEFDPIKLEIEKGKQQAKNGWSKKDTALIVAFAVGIAVLVYLVVKYGKNCVETRPPNCNIGTDDNCYCERYEEDDKARGVRLP